MDVQLHAFRDMISTNPVVAAILGRMPSLDLPDCWLAAGCALVDLGANIQLRNEARAHLWYEDKFATPCPPYRNTRHAISSFPNCSSCLGVRPVDGHLEVFAPYGVTDLFAMTTRPNPILAPASVYEAKTTRWAQQWSDLTVLPWPTLHELVREGPAMSCWPTDQGAVGASTLTVNARSAFVI